MDFDIHLYTYKLNIKHQKMRLLNTDQCRKITRENEVLCHVGTLEDASCCAFQHYEDREMKHR